MEDDKKLLYILSFYFYFEGRGICVVFSLFTFIISFYTISTILMYHSFVTQECRSHQVDWLISEQTGLHWCCWGMLLLISWKPSGGGYPYFLVDAVITQVWCGMFIFYKIFVDISGMVMEKGKGRVCSWEKFDNLWSWERRKIRVYLFYDLYLYGKGNG